MAGNSYVDISTENSQLVTLNSHIWGVLIPVMIVSRFPGTDSYVSGSGRPQSLFLSRQNVARSWLKRLTNGSLLISSSFITCHTNGTFI
jgi:hypothetical protein